MRSLALLLLVSCGSPLDPQPHTLTEAGRSLGPVDAPDASPDGERPDASGDGSEDAPDGAWMNCGDPYGCCPPGEVLCWPGPVCTPIAYCP